MSGRIHWTNSVKTFLIMLTH